MAMNYDHLMSLKDEGREFSYGDRETMLYALGVGFGRDALDENPERIMVAAEAVGIGRRAIDVATRYAKERMVFDRPIGQNQAIAHPLADSLSELEAADLLWQKAAWAYDSDRPSREAGALANMAKLRASEAGFRACDRALQVFGGFGYAREFHVERYWRESRLARIAPISNEMVHNYLSEHVLGLPRSY